MKKTSVFYRIIKTIAGFFSQNPDSSDVEDIQGKKFDESGSDDMQEGKRGLFGKPVVDYSKFRPWLLNDRRFSHLKLLGGWILYFAMYILTERLIPESACHVVHCALDDIIPFNEYFLIFYCAWYFWIGLTLIYYLFYDIEAFKRLQTFFIIVQLVAMIFYIIYPTIQNGRPESFERTNIFTLILKEFIYSVDTPTGVCPSLHVAYSIGIAESWLRRRKSSKIWKILMLILCIMVSLSTLFVKQHSVIDLFAAIPLAAVADFLLYERVGGRKSVLQKLLDKI